MIDFTACGSGRRRHAVSNRFAAGVGRCHDEPPRRTAGLDGARIETDYSSVHYAWGDGPVSSMLPFLADGVANCRIIASPGNCDAFKNLLESCNLAGFGLVRIDEVAGKSALTPVPFRIRVDIPFDETKLSARVREFASALFQKVLEDVDGPETFLAFAKALESDRRAAAAQERSSPSHPYGPDAGGWENTTIETFLEAAIAWADDSGFGASQGLQQASPWRVFATFLYCGKIYE